MKRIFPYIILLILLCNKSFAYLAPADSFRFEGTLKCGESTISGMLLNVYLDGKKVISKTSNRQGNFAIYLSHNKQYTIELIKKDFILQKIIIDTKVSDAILKGRGIEMAIDNEIPVFEYYDGLKTELFDNPVLFFVYNENNGYFEQDRKNSKASKLTAFTSKITTTKNKQANEALKQANTFYTKKMYEEALLAFNKVIELTPSNQAAQDKIKEINKILRANAGQLDQDYQKFLSAADEFFKEKKYSEAIEQYKKASALKPEQVYPKNQIFAIDSLVTQIYSKNKTEYDKFKKSGDAKYKNKEYQGAIEDYQTALTLLPDEPIVSKLLKNVQAALDAENKKKAEDLKALNEKVNSILKKATEYADKKDFANAIAMYNQALQLKPDDAEINALKEKATKQLEELAAIKLQQQKQKNFNDTLALGDSCSKIKDFNSALNFYKAASFIFPDDKKVLQKIKETERQLAYIEKQKTKIATNDTAAKNESTVNNTQLAEVQQIISKAQDSQKNDNLKQALSDLNTALVIAKKQGDKGTQTEVLKQLASVYYDSGMYRQTIKSFENALVLKTELNDQPGIADIYSEMGTTYNYIYQYDNSLDALNKALSIYQKLGNTEAKAETYNKMAVIYDKQNNFRKAAELTKLSLKEANLKGNAEMVSNLTNQLGVLYYKMGKQDLAAQYYNQVIESDSKSGNKRSLSLAFNNLGNINFDWNKYEAAISFYQKSLNLKKEMNFEEGIAVSLLNIGNAYLEMKKPIPAGEFLNSGLNMALKLNFKDVIKQSYQSLAKLYEMQHDAPNALIAYKELAKRGAISISGPMNETENMYTSESRIIRQLKKELNDQKILTENEALQNKQKEQQLALKEMQLAQQKAKNTRNIILLLFSLLVAISAGVIALLFFKRYEEKRKYSEIIEFQNRQITDSIEYASRIQKAVLPPVDFVKEIFPQSFILNKPKDIVSGDFYFVFIVADKIYVGVADCTGHGVPGAFMSMLGYTLSKEVVQMSESSPNSAQTLDLLRESLMKSLHQTGKDDEAKDGMDVALCIIDPKNKKLEFSGANNPCYIVRNNELIELKPDRMPIGIHPIIKPFNSHSFELKQQDTIYMFSDGYRDQISAESLKKFKKEQFSKLLLEINPLDMDAQLFALENKHQQWKGNMEQTDDIMVLGIKIQ